VLLLFIVTTEFKPVPADQGDVLGLDPRNAPIAVKSVCDVTPADTIGKSVFPDKTPTGSCEIFKSAIFLNYNFTIIFL
jgi:hypothetical protein